MYSNYLTINDTRNQLLNFQWDLVCDRDVILQFMAYVYAAATTTGYVILGHLGDRFVAFVKPPASE